MAATRRARASIALSLGRVLGLVLSLVLGHAAAEERVEFDSFDTADGRPVRLLAHWSAVATPGSPAVVLLHGCGGAYAADGRLGARMREYTALFHERGVSTLVLDSFSPRGERELCTQRNGTRRVTQAHRRLDALAAIEWLAQRPEVAADRIGLIGWSNGGSTVLAALNERRRALNVAPSARRPAFAVAFYPGCEAEGRHGFATQTPLLMLLGGADDWTPAAPCIALAGRASGLPPEVVTYPEAHHGFDSTAPVRWRPDVPNGATPGAGVHVGGHAEARARSRQALGRFIDQAIAR